MPRPYILGLLLRKAIVSYKHTANQKISQPTILPKTTWYSFFLIRYWLKKTLFLWLLLYFDLYNRNMLDKVKNVIWYLKLKEQQNAIIYFIKKIISLPKYCFPNSVDHCTIFSQFYLPQLITRNRFFYCSHLVFGNLKLYVDFC